MPIQQNADLNDYKIPGNYYCSENSIARTLQNCPVDSAFTMKVEKATGTSYSSQTIKSYLSQTVCYRYCIDSTGAWMGWVDSATKSDLEPYKYIKTFDFGAFDWHVETVDTAMKHILNTFPLDPFGKTTYICYFALDSIYRAIIQSYSDHNYTSAIVFSYAIGGIICYQKLNGVLRKYTTQWEGTVI